MKERKKLLDIAKAAAELNVHTATLRRWADKGKVPHVRMPSGVRRFHPEDIEALKQQMERRGNERMG